MPDGGLSGSAGSPGGGAPGLGGRFGVGGASSGRAGAGGAPGRGGAAGSSFGDAAQYNFETGAQGWTSGGTGPGPWTDIGPSTAAHFRGEAAFGGTIAATSAGETYSLSLTYPTEPGLVAGASITFHVYLPSNAAGVIQWVQPFVQDNGTAGSTSGMFYGAYTVANALTYGGWTAIGLVLPPTTTSPVLRIGVEFYAAGTWTGTVYVDSISW